MIIFIAWLLLAALTGKFASSRGRSGWGWGFVAVVFSPIVAFLLLLVLPNDAAEKARAIEASDSKTCPRCAETVKRAALVCRHCGHEFDPAPVSASNAGGAVETF